MISVLQQQAAVESHEPEDAIRLIIVTEFILVGLQLRHGSIYFSFGHVAWYETQAI